MQLLDRNLVIFMTRGCQLTPEEALDMGLIDEILKPEDK